MSETIFDQIADGRTDLVFDYVAAGHAATSADKDGVLIEYSGKEKSLLEYLEKMNRITVKEYCDLSKVSRRKAQRILVDLALSGVIRIHTTEKEEYYTAA